MVRISSAAVPESDLTAYLDYVQKVEIPAYEAAPGLVSVTLVRRNLGGYGDCCGNVVDPDGYTWMVGTHKAEPTAKEMKKGMEAMMKPQPAGAAAAD